MPEVTRKLAEPPGRTDPIEILDLRLSFGFRHSLGKLSPFFLALEQRRLLATRCGRCGAVWMPPRVTCPDDWTQTEWTELSGAGSLAVGAASAYTLGAGSGETAPTLGYVALDGASTLLFQQIRNVAPEALRPGLRLKAAWSRTPVEHPMQLFWFEPL